MDKAIRAKNNISRRRLKMPLQSLVMVPFDWLDTFSKKLILLTSKVGLKFARVEPPLTVRENQAPNVFRRQNLFRHGNRLKYFANLSELNNLILLDEDN
jgi:hypothetical protein